MAPLPIRAQPQAQPETPLGAPDTLWPCLPPAWWSVSTLTSCPFRRLAKDSRFSCLLGAGDDPAAGLEVSTAHREGEGRTRASTWRSSVARQREGVAYVRAVGADAPGPGVCLSLAEPFLFAKWCWCWCSSRPPLQRHQINALFPSSLTLFSWSPVFMEK